jgi:hypothetical protein
MTDKLNGEVDFESIDTKEFVMRKDVYYEIKQMFLEYIPETQFPTYDEWTKMVDNDEIHEPTLVGFRPGSPGAAAGLAGFAGRVGVEALRASGLKMNTADEALNSIREMAEQRVKQRIFETTSRMREKFTDTGDGGTSKEGYIGGSRWNPTGLSDTLKPMDTSFNTDIRFQGQTRYWQDGKENSGPLFIKAGTPGLVSTTANSNRDQQLWDFIQGPVVMEWNTVVANKVTWTGRVRDLLTETNISNYINRCLYVCSVYYFWRSVITFTDDPRNRNAGMDALRDQLSPSDYNNLFNLRREMMQSSIPPFIHEFVFYMMGNYRQSHLPTSPIMKIMPFGFASTSNTYFNGQVALDGNGLSPVDIARGHLSQLKSFNNVLSKAIGKWGGIEPFEYMSSPRVDADYTTFWVNGSYTATNSIGSLLYPRIDDDTEEVVYNIHTDAPDGWVSAMSAPYITNTDSFGVGLFKPWELDSAGTAVDNINCTYSTTKSTTCLMYRAENTAGFYPVEAAHNYQELSGNTYNTVATSGTYHKFQRFGTERVILTPINALRQANFQFLELLYTSDLRGLGTTPGIVQGKEVSVSRAGKNPYGGRKRRGKRKGKSSPYDMDKMKDEI